MTKVKVLCAALMLVCAFESRAANPGDEVIVIYNTQVPESKAVADYYVLRRQVPTNQVFGFALSTGAEMSRSEFQDALQLPLARALEEKKLWHIGAEMVRATTNRPTHVERKVQESKIRYAVLCYGVPYRIAADPSLKESAAENMRVELRRNEAAVDSELALLPCIQQHLPLAGPLVNPLYGVTNPAAFYPSNGILMVARLDGPSAGIARGLVDKALEAETNGLWGRAYIDMRNISDPGYKLGDDWMRGAAEICRHLGLETVVDENPATFPPEFPMSQIAFYCGWYDGEVSGPFTRANVEFMPGAFAYHLHSASALDLRSATHCWVGPLLAKGATITMGSVAEPYLGGTPDLAVFAGRLIYHGSSFGEAAYASQATVSWQTTVIGDPLYRPFGKSPQQLLVELVGRQSKLIEWYFLRRANINLANGVPAAQVTAMLEQIETTKGSAVLTEKLGDLYSAQGKPSSAVEMWERTLTLEPSPQQRVRLRLALAEKLTSLNRNQEAVDNLAKILQENADYPAPLEIYKKLLPLAQKLGKTEAAVQYEVLIKQLTPVPLIPK